MTTITPTAPPCLSSTTTGGSIFTSRKKPFRGRGLCRACYNREHRRGTIEQWPILDPVQWANSRRHAVPKHPDPLPAVVFPAMVGIAPGQPPTDPALTPRRVRQIANLNNLRAMMWLQRHPELATADAWEALCWEEARPAAKVAA